MEAANSVNLIAALALYQQRRDSAIGLAHITAKQRGLIWYYNMRQRELLQKTIKASFVHGVMQQIDQRMSEIMTEAQGAPIERKRELLQEALNLRKQANRVKKQQWPII